MKYVKIFTAFILLHVVAWVATHVYENNNKVPVLVVVDTSFSMKPKFPKVRQWIDSYEQQNRYKRILVGTDKALLGNLDELPSKDMIFRTSFGKLQESNIKRHYGQLKAKEKFLLSDGSLTLPGWDTIEF